MDAYKPQVRKKLTSWVIWGLVTFAAVISFLVYMKSYGGSQDATDSRKVLVEQADIKLVVGARIKFVPKQSGLLTNTIGGTLVEVMVVPGSKVKKGDPLLRLVNGDYEQQLINAVSEYAAAEADNIGIVMQSQDDILLRQAEVTRAQKTLEVVNIQFEGERKLSELGITSKIMLRKLEAERDKQVAENIYVSERLKNALPAAAARIEASKLKLDVLRQRRDRLQQTVDGLVLRAPFDGVVASVESQIGKLLTPGAKGAEIITNELNMEIDIAEQDAELVKAGLRITALRKGKVIEGVITSVAPSSESGTVKATATLAKLMGDLRSNTVLNGEIIIGTLPNVLYVETDGAEIEGKKESVSIHRNGEEIKSDVVFGRRSGQKVLILSGAENGDYIILPESSVR